MKYRVTIKSGYNPSTGETLLTNEQAIFSYIDYLGRNAEAEFPKPEVTVGGGKLLVHWYQVNDKGLPVNAQGTVVESPALAHQVQPAEYHSVNGSTGLLYNTPYTVDHKIFDGYTYYGSYILNDGSLTEGDSATVTLAAANSNQDLWFAYGRDFKVAHVQNGTVVQTDTHAVTEHFDLTAPGTHRASLWRRILCRSLWRRQCPELCRRAERHGLHPGGRSHLLHLGAE